VNRESVNPLTPNIMGSNALFNVVSYDVTVSFEASMWQMFDMRIGV
jgi:hypothetical protein